MTPLFRMFALASAASALALAFAPPAAACDAAAGDSSGLLACIADLEKRVYDLENPPAEPPDDTDDRLSALEDQMKATQDQNTKLNEQVATLTEKVDKPKYKAPFVVEDETGAALFTVDKDGAEVSAIVGAADGDRVRLAIEGDRAVMSAVNGENAVIIDASNSSTALTATSSRGIVGLGHLSNGVSGFRYGPSGGAIYAQLGREGSGEPGLKVKTNGGSDAVYAGTEGTSSRVVIGKIGGNFIMHQVTSTVATGEFQFNDRRVLLGSSGDGAYVRTTLGTYTTEIGGGGEFTGLKLKFQDKEIANLGVISGRGAAVRIMNSNGATVAAMGANLEKGGAGAVRVGNGDRNGALLESDSSGYGSVSAFGSGDSAAASLEGKERVVAVYDDTGKPLVTMSKSPNSGGGNITARKPNGDGVFSAGYATNGGGEACVWRAKQANTFCLGVGLPGMGVGK